MKKTMKLRKRLFSGFMAFCTAAVLSLTTFGSTVLAADDCPEYPEDIDPLEVNSAIQPVYINETTFPDPMFRAVISDPEYDKDQNGYLDAQEILYLRNIHCDNMGIKSVKGIEYLVELRGLYCTHNEISSWDLSNNKLLTGIWCDNNLFTSLDFSANTELLWVYCTECKLTNLNVSNNSKLAFLECNTNPLKTLDVSHNPELEHLMCGTCQLSKLDLSNNQKLQHLDAFQNNLKTLDVTCCPKMKRLDIWSNRGLGSIDVSKCPGLQYYNCSYNDVTKIDVTHNPELTKLSCAYNSIKTLDLSKNPKLCYLDCACNQISNLDLKYHQRLHFLQAFTNSFKTLNIGDNPLLIKTYKEGVKKAEYSVCVGHSWTIDYHLDDSTQGDSLYFLCFDDAVTLKIESSGRIPEYDPRLDEEPSNTTNLITRAYAVQVLYEMAGKPDVSGLKTRFTDVRSDSPYYNALLWGEKNSICVGYHYVAENTFGVDKWLSRQDLACFLMRYSEYAGYNRAIDFGRSDDFIDYFDIDNEHWEGITWAITWNIMWGVEGFDKPREETHFRPYQRVTFTEFKNTINEMLEANGKAKYTPSKTPVNYTVLTDIEYDGTEKHGIKTNSRFTVTGNSATVPGKYTATLTLNDKKNTIWYDGTTADKKITWTIKKKNITNGIKIPAGFNRAYLYRKACKNRRKAYSGHKGSYSR
ncbi:hypothetical protein SAMN04487934_10131 [Eubacterium ruminantium]|nr:hypothetical protein SAMN04487934_10131 [Eubacterium ruminantium]